MLTTKLNEDNKEDLLEINYSKCYWQKEIGGINNKKTLNTTKQLKHFYEQAKHLLTSSGLVYLFVGEMFRKTKMTGSKKNEACELVNILTSCLEKSKKINEQVVDKIEEVQNLINNVQYNTNYLIIQTNVTIKIEEVQKIINKINENVRDGINRLSKDNEILQCHLNKAKEFIAKYDSGQNEEENKPVTDNEEVNDESLLFCRSLAQFMSTLSKEKEIQFRVEVEKLKLKLNFIEYK
ncbi:BESS domain-containing protein [Meloidogyne graminicola]|uniref:BESS domain-containing protein n=1 Tax=Meloidogyne graminicola TaxID=189291 RepID=A0A8T0A4A5_9BILA|nr:BESS domain-containing protein [Meloidogyne graminicola]